MISASVVLFNTPNNQIDSIIECYKPSQERILYLVDNSSDSNPYCENLSKDNGCIFYIFNNSNLGYGKAHNLAIDKSIEVGADYHIVLNPDITFDSRVINELVEYADAHEDVVYMLPRVIYPDGSLQYLCKLLPNPFDLIFRRFIPFLKIAQKRNDKYTLRASGYNKIINPPCLSGCFMFMRVSTLATQSIRFDDRFFMYCEDFDLMRRLHRVGKTIFYPYVEIIHDHGKESYRNWRMLKCHIISAIKYFNKYGWFFDSERKAMNEKILKEIELSNNESH